MTKKKEELILRAALYCVDEMLHNNKDVISFDKSNDGIDGYVDITTVHNYLSEKINDLKHSRESLVNTRRINKCNGAK